MKWQQWLLLLSCWTSLAFEVQDSYSVGDVNELAAPCRTARNVVGYSNLEDIHEDQLREAERVKNGESPRTPYVFPLCPFTTFEYSEESQTGLDLDTPWAATLYIFLEEDVVVVCGTTGEQANNCTFHGGEVNVQVTKGGNPEQEVAFLGISFQDFSKFSVLFDTDSTRAVWFQDVLWEDFEETKALVSHLYSDPIFPSITVNKAVVRNGNSDGIFDNFGGQLSLTDILVSNVYGGHVIESADLEGESATTIVQNMVVEGSSVLSVIILRGGDEQNMLEVSDCVVRNMTRVDNAFNISGSNIATIDSVIFQHNNHSETTDSTMAVLQASSGSQVTCSDLVIENNAGRPDYPMIAIQADGDGTKVMVSNIGVQHNTDVQVGQLIHSSIDVSPVTSLFSHMFPSVRLQCQKSCSSDSNQRRSGRCPRHTCESR